MGERTVLCGGSLNDRKALHEMLNELRSTLKPIPGVLVEDKGLTASVHFRMVAANDLGNLSHLFNLMSNKYENLLRITSGRKVFEISPIHAWNKGDAVYELSMPLEGVPLFVGDDVTDEDDFRAIKKNGVSVSIGGCLGSDFYLKGQEDVRRMLEIVLDLAETPAA